MRTKRMSTVIMAAGLLAAVLCSPLLAKEESTVVSPDSKAYGKTYDMWTANWWQWVASIPAHDAFGNNQHPFWDDTGEDAARQQTGPVWFLVGMSDSFPDPADPNVFYGIAERDLTIPEGKAIFFPIINVECSTAEDSSLTTEEELRGCTSFYMTGVQDLACEFDGVPIADLDSYRTASPLFTFDVIEDGFLNELYGVEFPVGTTLAVDEGYYMMLSPPSVGPHELHFHGAFVFTEEEHGFDWSFVLDITYQLTVTEDEQ